MGKGLYIEDEFFKGIRTIGTGGGAPYYKGAKAQGAGELGGMYTGQLGGGGAKTQYGPKGGHIKKLSATTGKPIYYKKWNAGNSNAVKLAQPTEGGGTPEGYQVYKHHPEHVIGSTSRGEDIHAHSGINNTKHYRWDDHRDASHAHFALVQHLMNVLRDRSASGKDVSKLQGLIDAHAHFSQHHREEALKDLLHGKQKGSSQEDLSLREGARSK